MKYFNLHFLFGYIQFTFTIYTTRHTCVVQYKCHVIQQSNALYIEMCWNSVVIHFMFTVLELFETISCVYYSI